ncbi:hypothetical protein [Legionella fairfieldensis]|uniref:hypothetical protein n=1 Tax=Legionella fairfieldensis TaxID=45064 RepID=UPI00048FC6A1|nr:hypothetical protein [Legionella fairfieldensis]
MTIKAVYSASGEKPFSFPLYVSNKSVDNTEYKKINLNLPSFESNEIVLFEGNNKGYFLTVIHEEEPVCVLKSTLSKEELDNYLYNERIECKQFNYSLSAKDVFFVYYLLNHSFYQTDPSFPCFHFLIKEVEGIEHFYSLYRCYESLYEKLKNSKNVDFFQLLNEDELNIFKFSIFCNSGDVPLHLLCEDMLKNYLRTLPDLKADAFEKFGISDFNINGLIRTLKMNPYYYIGRIYDDKSPSVFYIDYPHPDIESFLKPEDELILWRAGKKFCEYLTDNFNSIADMNESRLYIE